MKILFYEVRKQYCQKKLPFLAQKLEKKICLPKSVSGYYKTKKKKEKKESGMDQKAIGVGRVKP